MYDGEQVLNLLGRLGRGDAVVDASRLAVQAVESRRDPDAIAWADMRAYFGEPPTAGSLGLALQHLDREARRVVKAMEVGVPPATLRGPGLRLMPLSEGLVVRSASEGSLDVEMILGGIYAAVVSQPVSFMLNLASLLGHGRVVVQAMLPNGKQDAAHVDVEVVADRPALDTYPEPILIPTENGPAVIPPGGWSYVELRLRSSDGSSVDFRAGGED